MNKEQLTARLTELTNDLNRLAIQVYKVREEVKTLTHEISVTPAPAPRRDCAAIHRDGAVDQTTRPVTIRIVYKGEFRD